MHLNWKTFLRQNYLAVLILIFGICGFVASFTLTLEKFELLRNPNAILPCNLNPFLNCGIVMRSPYAEIFGVPWSLLGVAGYGGILAMVFFLFEHRKTSRFLAYATTLGTFGAFALSTYFMWLSAYVIGVFCPWCVLSAISSTGIFFAMVTNHLRENNYKLPDQQAEYIQRKIKGGWNVPIVVLWYVFIILLEVLPFVLARMNIFIR